MFEIERVALFADTMQMFQIGECSYTMIFSNPWSGQEIAIRIQKNIFDTVFENRSILPYDSIEKVESRDKHVPNFSS